MQRLELFFPRRGAILHHLPWLKITIIAIISFCACGRPVGESPLAGAQRCSQSLCGPLSSQHGEHTTPSLQQRRSLRPPPTPTPSPTPSATSLPSAPASLPAYPLLRACPSLTTGSLELTGMSSPSLPVSRYFSRFWRPDVSHPPYIHTVLAIIGYQPASPAPSCRLQNSANVELCIVCRIPSFLTAYSLRPPPSFSQWVRSSPSHTPVSAFVPRASHCPTSRHTTTRSFALGAPRQSLRASQCFPYPLLPRVAPASSTAPCPPDLWFLADGAQTAESNGAPPVSPSRTSPSPPVSAAGSSLDEEHLNRATNLATAAAPQTVSSTNPKQAALAANDMNIVRRKLTGYVGFANLPNQWHRKSVRKGFNFNVMVVGMSIPVFGSSPHPPMLCCG